MTNKTLLIHNPNCSKSRGAKEILEEKGISFDTLHYLNHELSDELLKALPTLLGLEYPAMIRTNETIYRELDLSHQNLDSKQWIEILKKHPVLLERPIFIHRGQAVIARPPEKVWELL